MTYHATKRTRNAKKLSPVKIIRVEHELVPKLKKLVD